MVKLSIALVTALFATSGLSSEVSSRARSYHLSCGYYSATVSDVEIQYKNGDLPWGVQVELIYGLEGHRVRGGGDQVTREPFAWGNKASAILTAVGPFVWKKAVHVQTHGRSSNEFAEGLDFVFRITYADGSISYDAPDGYYRTQFPKEYVRCVDSDDDRPDYNETEVFRVRRS